MIIYIRSEEWFQEKVEKDNQVNTTFQVSDEEISSLKSEICSKDAAYITPTSIDNMISNIINNLREGRKDA